MERQRSLWAWGWADKFPDEGARKGLAHACMRTGRLRLKTDAVQQRWPEGLIEEPAPKLDRQKRIGRVAPSR